MTNNNLRAWQVLRTLSEPSPTLTIEKYIDICHDMRATELHRLKQYPTSAGVPYADLAHYIWRLGATRAATNTVVDAILAVPSLLRISEIRTVQPPPAVEKAVHASRMSPHEILHSIVAESTSPNPLQVARAFARLHELDAPGTRRLFHAMAPRSRIVVRVHAELQLADAFSRARDMEFVDGDRYIGCSKPACYFCYNWLLSHRHRYVTPATHYKIIPGCRGMDGQLNAAGAGVLRDLYARIARRVGQDVLGFLESESNVRAGYMSTEASTRAVSMIESV
jgi:hypothetical protein